VHVQCALSLLRPHCCIVPRREKHRRASALTEGANQRGDVRDLDPCIEPDDRVADRHLEHAAGRRTQRRVRSRQLDIPDRGSVSPQPRGADNTSSSSTALRGMRIPPPSVGSSPPRATVHHDLLCRARVRDAIAGEIPPPRKSAPRRTVSSA
jgi:hypothetical protein